MKYGYDKLKEMNTEQTTQDRIKQLEEQVANLEEINSNKSLWLSLLAHDFKGFFSNTIWFVDAMATGKISEDIVKEILPELKKSAEKGLSLLDDTLKATKLHWAATEKEDWEWPAAELCESLKTFFKDYLSQKKITFSSSVPEPLKLTVNPHVLNSVLVKIVDNAIKFSHAGGKINMEIGKTGEGDIQIKVQDWGIGMDSRTLNAIFLLNHAPYLGTDDELGAGVGLSLAKEALSLLGGRMKIRSTLEEGTEVLVTLPDRL